VTEVQKALTTIDASPFFMTRGDTADRGRREPAVQVIEDQIKKIKVCALTP
jgi:hypothetical protein